MYASAYMWEIHLPNIKKAHVVQIRNSKWHKMIAILKILESLKLKYLKYVKITKLAETNMCSS